MRAGLSLSAPRKYWAVFRTQLANRLAYAGDLASQSIAIVFFMWVFVQLWRTTYSAAGAGEAGQTIAGLTLNDTVWYLMVTETIVLTRLRVWRAISEAVKDGSIAYLLNKPFNFLLYHFSVGLGDSLSAMLFYILAGGGLVWLLVGPPPSLGGLPLVLVAIGLSWSIDFCFSALIGLAAFVTEEVSAFDWIYSKLLFLLGGMLIPIDFFPGWLQAIAKALPFAYTVYGPARLFVDPTLERFSALLLAQLLWLMGLGGIVALVYRKSVAWLNINGG